MERRVLRAALDGWALTGLAGTEFVVVYALTLESSLHRATSDPGDLGSTLLALTLSGLVSSQVSMAATTSSYLQRVVQRPGTAATLATTATARCNAHGSPRSAG